MPIPERRMPNESAAGGSGGDGVQLQS